MHIIWRMLGANGKNWRKLTSVYDIVTGKRLLRAHRAEVDVEDPGRIIMESASTSLAEAADDRPKCVEGRERCFR